MKFQQALLLLAASSLFCAGVVPNVCANDLNGGRQTLAGVVHRPDGQPAAGLPVRTAGAFRADELGIKTDANGRFEINWDPSIMARAEMTICVFVRDVEHNLAAAEELDDDATNVDLTLAPAISVVGKAEAAGKPLSDVTGALIFWTGHRGTYLQGLSRTNGLPGQFEIQALPAGRRYGVMISAPGYGQAAHHDAVTSSTEAGRVELDSVELKPANLKLMGRVVDAEDKPVEGARVNLSGAGQPNGSVRTGKDGSFAFEHVCEGALRLYANARGASADVPAEGGETNMLIQLGDRPSTAAAGSPPAKPSLTGKRLPDLASVNIDPSLAPEGKPVLLCLFDASQRPSRAIIRKLQEQSSTLKAQGITVLGVQATAMTDDAYGEWKSGNQVTFPLGRVTEAKLDLTKWASNAAALPWLILANDKREVIAEGFALDELEAQLKKLK